MKNRIMVITTSSDYLPKEEQGTLAAERLHCYVKIYINKSDNFSHMTLLRDIADIEFDTEVVPEGNPRYPQKYKPVDNYKVIPLDSRGPLTLIDMSDRNSVSHLYLHEFTPDLTGISLFDEFDPDKVKEISDELARLTQDIQSI